MDSHRNQSPATGSILSEIETRENCRQVLGDPVVDLKFSKGGGFYLISKFVKWGPSERKRGYHLRNETLPRVHRRQLLSVSLCFGFLFV